MIAARATAAVFLMPTPPRRTILASSPRIGPTGPDWFVTLLASMANSLAPRPHPPASRAEPNAPWRGSRRVRSTLFTVLRTKESSAMKWNIALSALVISAGLCCPSYGFELFNRLIGGGGGCGCCTTCAPACNEAAAPACNAAAAPSCEAAAAAAAPSCEAPAGPSCGGAAPSCEAAAPSCCAAAPSCGCVRQPCLWDCCRLKHSCAHSCCAPKCCNNTCGNNSCCAPKCCHHHHHCCRSGCKSCCQTAPTCGCAAAAPSCGCGAAAPSCGGCEAPAAPAPQAPPAAPTAGSSGAWFMNTSVFNYNN